MKTALVIGSGAGGCAAALELSANFHVTVLEAGTDFAPFKYQVESFEPLRKAGLFFDEKMIELLFPEMRIVKAHEGLIHVNARCVGGTTAISTGNALRYDHALAERGIHLDEEFAQLAELVPTTQEHYRTWSDLTVRLFEVFEEAGFDPQVTPKFHHVQKRCIACGHCVLGCRFGAKWTADELIANNPRIRMLDRHTTTRLLIENDQVVGVETHAQGQKKTLVADLVVLAAGGLNTPLILNASGIKTTSTLFVDPVLCVAAPFDDASLEAQVPMPFVSQRDGYILSPYFDWLSFFFNKQWRIPARSIMSIMIKYADSCFGSYNGKTMYKPTTAHDAEIVARSVEESMQILERMGVKRSDMFLGTLNAGHPGGCLPLSEAEADTLHHAQLPQNLYVADASLLPQSMGNPPILTIMALALRVSKAATAALL